MQDYDLKDFHRLIFIPTASFFFRTKSYDALMKAGIRHCPSDDLRLRLFVTSQGYAHFINEKTCVYREGGSASMMSGWKKQDRGQKELDAKRNYGMLSDLDQYTDYTWHKGLRPFMATSAAGMLENASLPEFINNPVYREIFNTMKKDRKIKTLVKAAMSGYSGLRGS